MRKLFISIIAAIVVAFSGGSISYAQDDGPPNFVPLEMQACTYKDRKDSDDFDDALATITEVEAGSGEHSRRPMSADLGVAKAPAL